MEPEIVRIKVQPLTAEAFKPYGVAMETGKHLIFPEVDEGSRVALEFVPLKHRMERVHQLNLHFSYSQAFIPVKGTLILLVAPPPRNVGAPRENYEFDWEQGGGFLFRAGPGRGSRQGHVAHAVQPGRRRAGHFICERHSQESPGRAPSIPIGSSPTSPGSIL